MEDITNPQHGEYLFTSGYHLATVLLEQTSDRIQVTANHGELVHARPQGGEFPVRESCEVSQMGPDQH